MKTNFSSKDDLLQNKTIEIQNVTLVVRAFFHESSKYYPQAFLDECLYEL